LLDSSKRHVVVVQRESLKRRSMVSPPLAENSLAVVPRDPDLHAHPSSDFGE
jgi:hypothetical protein